MFLSSGLSFSKILHLENSVRLKISIEIKLGYKFKVENIFLIKSNKCRQDKETFLIPTPEVHNKTKVSPPILLIQLQELKVVTPISKPEDQNSKDKEKLFSDSHRIIWLSPQAQQIIPRSPP